MSELQDKLSQILNNPEALAQVQSLGQQLGLAPKKQESEKPPESPKAQPPALGGLMNDDMLKTITRLAPLMSSVKEDDNTTRLLNALRPFLSEEKQERLDKAEKMLKLFKLMPLLKNSGMF